MDKRKRYLKIFVIHLIGFLAIGFLHGLLVFGLPPRVQHAIFVVAALFFVCKTTWLICGLLLSPDEKEKKAISLVYLHLSLMLAFCILIIILSLLY